MARGVTTQSPFGGSACNGCARGPILHLDCADSLTVQQILDLVSMEPQIGLPVLLQSVKHLRRRQRVATSLRFLLAAGHWRWRGGAGAWDKNGDSSRSRGQAQRGHEHRFRVSGVGDQPPIVGRTRSAVMMQNCVGSHSLCTAAVPGPVVAPRHSAEQLANTRLTSTRPPLATPASRT